jgi:16S rRNA (uracil1498-N3)-methyltransferase
MRRFFTEPQNVSEGKIYIYDDARHIQKVLRMNCGDEVLVFDGTGNEYTARLVEIKKDVCIAEMLDVKTALSEPKTEITLFQALPKSGKMEMIVQKAVELGVSRIVPVVTERCVTRINSKSAAEEKSARWTKVSVEAAKQCGRGKVPAVTEPVEFKEAVEMLCNMQLPIMPYEVLGHEGRLGLKELLQGNSEALEIGILVGPEGGFSDEEAQFAISCGVNPVGLGKRILRTETVASAIIPVIMFDRNEF